MTPHTRERQKYNILIIGQNGRLQYEAALFAASLKHSDPGFPGKLYVAEPEPGNRWEKDPRMGNAAVRSLLQDLDAEIVQFRSDVFGQPYPQGNKIEGLSALPADEPFVFFDTDTLITNSLSGVTFDFTRPSASMRREGTWPTVPLYGPGYFEIWKSLYDKFGLDFETTLDTSHPEEYWQRFMYFNAGWFYYKCPKEFGTRFLEYAQAINDDPPEELAAQELYPWLDQITLPLVIHAFGGGRPGAELSGLDGDVSCHWRVMPLFYARESDHAINVLEAATAENKIKKVLKQYEPFKRMIFQKRGHKARAMFDRNKLPPREQMIRNQIKNANLWMR